MCECIQYVYRFVNILVYGINVEIFESADMKKEEKKTACVSNISRAHTTHTNCDHRTMIIMSSTNGVLLLF